MINTVTQSSYKRAETSESTGERLHIFDNVDIAAAGGKIGVNLNSRWLVWESRVLTIRPRSYLRNGAVVINLHRPPFTSHSDWFAWIIIVLIKERGVRHVGPSRCPKQSSHQVSSQQVQPAEHQIIHDRHRQTDRHRHFLLYNIPRSFRNWLYSVRTKMKAREINCKWMCENG